MLQACGAAVPECLSSMFCPQAHLHCLDFEWSLLEHDVAPAVHAPMSPQFKITVVGATGEGDSVGHLQALDGAQHGHDAHSIVLDLCVGLVAEHEVFRAKMHLTFRRLCQV